MLICHFFHSSSSFSQSVSCRCFAYKWNSIVVNTFARHSLTTRTSINSQFSYIFFSLSRKQWPRLKASIKTGKRRCVCTRDSETTNIDVPNIKVAVRLRLTCKNVLFIWWWHHNVKWKMHVHSRQHSEPRSNKRIESMWSEIERKTSKRRFKKYM